VPGTHRETSEWLLGVFGEVLGGTGTRWPQPRAGGRGRSRGRWWPSRSGG
jgi:hypothetical protein